MPDAAILPTPDRLILPIPDRLIVPTPDVLLLPTPELVMLPMPDPSIVPIPDIGWALEPAPDEGALATPVCGGCPRRAVPCDRAEPPDLPSAPAAGTGDTTTIALGARWKKMSG